MEDFEENKIDKISHTLHSLATDVQSIKSEVIERKEQIDKIKAKENRRKESLKKSQKKFINIATNLKEDEFKRVEPILEKLKINKSAYIKKLIMEDIERFEKNEDDSE